MFLVVNQIASSSVLLIRMTYEKHSYWYNNILSVGLFQLKIILYCLGWTFELYIFGQKKSKYSKMYKK